MTTLAAPATTAVVSAHDIVKIYGAGATRVVALDHITIDFARGRFSVIMGPSGSGKSTLLHCLCGLEPVTSGSICIADQPLTELNEHQRTMLRRDHIGFVFQTFNLVPVMTARENITLPIRLAGRRVDDAWFDTVVAALELGDRLHHRPSELSGGQQQRVAVARSLLTRPDIIFADEPTGNLDSRSGSDVLDMLRRAVDDFGQTVVMVTHDPNAASHGDRVVFLDDGRFVDEQLAPSADDIIDRMKKFRG